MDNIGLYGFIIIVGQSVFLLSLRQIAYDFFSHAVIIIIFTRGL